MKRFFNQVTIEDLSSDTYLVKFPKDLVNEGYTFTNGLNREIQYAYPNKNFVWVPEYINFEELPADAIDLLIEQLTEARGKINERIGNENNVDS